MAEVVDLTLSDDEDGEEVERDEAVGYEEYDGYAHYVESDEDDDYIEFVGVNSFVGSSDGVQSPPRPSSPTVETEEDVCEDLSNRIRYVPPWGGQWVTGGNSGHCVRSSGHWCAQRPTMRSPIFGAEKGAQKEASAVSGRSSI